MLRVSTIIVIITLMLINSLSGGEGINVKSTTKATFEQDVIKSTKIVLLDVWAPWCAPCRSMEPVLELVENETKDWAEIIKLDASIEMDLVQELGVSSLPTFLIYKNGQIVGSSSATSKANLIELMSQAK